MPSWERFKELCNLRFGPAVRGTRLSKLARLPFLTMVQEYSDRFNVVLCHARNLSPLQKAELFVGGLLPLCSHGSSPSPRDQTSPSPCSITTTSAATPVGP